MDDLAQQLRHVVTGIIHSKQLGTNIYLRILRVVSMIHSDWIIHLFGYLFGQIHSISLMLKLQLAKCWYVIFFFCPLL